MLEVRNLFFAYPARPVLCGATFMLQKGQMVALLSPNAGGKSTLLRLCAGLFTPDAGQIAVEGADLRTLKAKERAKRIAYLPQSRPVPDIPVWDFAAHGRYPRLSRRHILTHADRDAVETALQMTGCAALRHRRLPELSGGQRQKAYLALALAQESPILLLDEPTAALDVKAQLETMRLLAHHAAQGGSVLLAIHDVALAMRFCTDFFVLREGQIFGRSALNATFGVRFDERGAAW
jgi:iron complex transport system ATP-binding protein